MKNSAYSIMIALIKNYRNDGNGLDKRELASQTGFSAGTIQIVLTTDLMYRRWTVGEESLVVSREQLQGPYASKYFLTSVEDARRQHLNSHSSDVATRSRNDMRMSRLLLDDYETEQNRNIFTLARAAYDFADSLACAGREIPPAEIQRICAEVGPFLQTALQRVEDIRTEEREKV